MSASSYDNPAYWSGMHAGRRGLLSAVGYSGFGEGFNRESYRLRRSALLRLLQRNPLASGTSLLEAAVGVGAYWPVWRRLGVARWVGLDIAGDAVAHCRQTWPEDEFLTQNLAEERWTADPATEAGFELVTAIDVLYHLVDESAFEAALRNLGARVRPGGALVVSDVFVAEARRIAPHVKRRSIADYERILASHMVLADRELVFAVLGDPVPRPDRPWADQALALAWGLLARTILATPAALREGVGAGAVWASWPVDAVLRRLGIGRGVNLELALFRDTRCAE